MFDPTLPHPRRGKIVNRSSENQLTAAVAINRFFVTDILYLNGHFIAVKRSRLTNKMLIFEAPPKRIVNIITMWQGIGFVSPVARKTAIRRGIATTAWHKSATAKFAKKRSETERRFRLMQMATSTSKFPPKAMNDITIKKTPVITELM